MMVIDGRKDGDSPKAVQEEDVGRGRHAEWPSEIPTGGWKDIVWRTWRKLDEDRVMLVSAGVTFYLLLALFPAMTAFVSTYGLFTDPRGVPEQIASLAALLPAQAMTIVSDRLESLASQDRGQLGIGFVTGLLFAFWSANNGVKSLFEALNVAYQEREKRSFLRLNTVAFAFTLGAMVTAVLLIGAVGLIPLVIGLLELGTIPELVFTVGQWLVFVALVAVGISLLYAFGPSRKRARWRWVTWGSALATVIWLLTSVSFSWYLQNFGNYDAIYGSLGAMIGFLMWIWLSVMILILGAEINAEIEHQTVRDSTVGADKALGERGAVVADTVGERTKW